MLSLDLNLENSSTLLEQHICRGCDGDGGRCYCIPTFSHLFFCMRGRLVKKQAKSPQLGHRMDTKFWCCRCCSSTECPLLNFSWEYQTGRFLSDCNGTLPDLKPDNYFVGMEQFFYLVIKSVNISCWVTLVSLVG